MIWKTCHLKGSKINVKDVCHLFFIIRPKFRLKDKILSQRGNTIECKTLFIFKFKGVQSVYTKGDFRLLI